MKGSYEKKDLVLELVEGYDIRTDLAMAAVDRYWADMASAADLGDTYNGEMIGDVEEDAETVYSIQKYWPHGDLGGA